MILLQLSFEGVVTHLHTFYASGILLIQAKNFTFDRLHASGTKLA